MGGCEKLPHKPESPLASKDDVSGYWKGYMVENMAGKDATEWLGSGNRLWPIHLKLDQRGEFILGRGEIADDETGMSLFMETNGRDIPVRGACVDGETILVIGSEQYTEVITLRCKITGPKMSGAFVRLGKDVDLSGIVRLRKVK